jgi:hypothetical protein
MATRQLAEPEAAPRARRPRGDNTEPNPLFDPAAEFRAEYVPSSSEDQQRHSTVVSASPASESMTARARQTLGLACIFLAIFIIVVAMR